MKFKKRITVTLIFLLVFNFLDSITIFAENLSINLMTNLKVNAIEVATDSLVKLKEKDIVELEVKFINNNNLIQPGDEIKVILPTILENVTIDYPTEYFLEGSVSNENTYLLNFSDEIVDKSEVSFFIKGSVSEVKEDLEDSILINMKNNEEKIDVNVTKEKLIEDIGEVSSLLKEGNALEEGYEVNLNSEITMLSETGFKAIGVKDNTQIITNRYLAKNGFQYVKDGVNYTSNAFDFHIFSKQANLSAHTNGNIATKELLANGQGFGTNQSHDLKSKEENYFMNSVDGITNIASDGNIIVGWDVDTNLEDNNNKVNIGSNGSGLDPSKSSRVYKETRESISYIDIDNEFENLKTISSLFSNHKTSLGVTLSEVNGENQTITVDKSIENVNNYYLNIKASEISNESSKRVLNIKIPERKTLIINVDMAGVSINYLQKLVTKMNDHNNSEEVVRYENNILWNLYDSSVADKVFTTTEKEYALVGTSDYFMGTILAPNANIQYGAVNGSIIANKTKQNSQESHKWSFTGHINENTTTSVTIEATKTLVGKELVADMFSFELLDKDDKVLQTVSNNADGKVQFESINYDAVGDYEYKVREVQGNVDGITYDKSEFKITVNVIENEQGKLVAEVKYPSKKPEFNNSYKAGLTSATIIATKTLSGKELVADMFSFELLDNKGILIEKVKNDVDGKIKFDTLNFDKVGTYTYKIVEVNGGLDGISYDSKDVDVTITVTDNGKGQLKAEVKYPSKKPEFNNSYKAGSTSATIIATKTLSGKELVADVFSFELLDDKGILIEKVKNDVDGKIKFTTLNFEKVGTYTYKIVEVNEGLDGITYDSKDVDVTITVTDNGKGQLEAELKYPSKKPEFNNSYKAGSTSATIIATKELIGKDLTSGMFSFELLDNKGILIEKVKNDVDGKIKFDTLNFDKVGTYTYKIVEVNEGLDGIIYDSQGIDVTIIVTDNGKGQLKAEVKYPSKKPEFNNIYKSGSTNASIEATKTLSGKELVADMFSFELLDKDGQVLQTVNNSANGKVQFESINYDDIGTYKYKVREVKGNLGGVSYDERVYDVTLNVTDDGSGKLVATVVYPNNKIEFSNKYKAKVTSTSIEATKILVGKELTSGMFSFELLDDKGNLVEKVKNDVDGKIKFNTLSFDKVGTYTYKIVEVNGGLDGITYDSQGIDVTIIVTDNGKGQLKAEVKYPSKKSEFNNSYKAGSTSATIIATKTLSGKELVADMFSFELLDKDYKVLQTVSNSSDGKIKFNTLNFDKVGTYTYKIVEVNGGLDGITYDSQGIDVTIIVTDNGKGQLEAEVKYPSKKPEFNNIYKSGLTNASIEATKKLTGKDLKAGMFSFELLDKDGNVLQTVTNGADGTVKFADITYDSVGDYEYTVREIQGNLEGITYDNSTFKITVNVSDNGKGKLIAKVVYPESKVVFENKIIQGSIEITKTDIKNGKPLANAEFTIRDSEGKVIVLGKTDENGKVVFEGLKYGKYTYQETVAPKEYVIDNKEYQFEIKEDRVVVKATMTNERKSAVTDKTSTPNTGDTGIATALVIGLLGVGGLFINNKKKKNIKSNNS